MQTRIKVKETVGGDKTYYIQKRRDFYQWQLYLIPVYGWLGFLFDLFVWEDVWNGWDDFRENVPLQRNVYYDEDRAKLSIDLFYSKREKLLIVKKENKTKKTTYIKYP